ncbi:hypothetical protein [Sphingomonas sp. H160509]|uniref:hypothetical protein n=1 Tax=Sphingomonas sp. H160509 TaxID=2955313 RepID=UPI0031598357
MGSLPTGAKLFLIISAALLPLALIAVFATLQTTRLADAEARARLRVTADESARAIAIELVGDMTALRVAVNALGTDPADAPSCARAQGVFAQQSSAGTRFIITDRAGHVLCGVPLPNPVTVRQDNMPVAAAIVPDNGLIPRDFRTQRRHVRPRLLPTRVPGEDRTSLDSSVGIQQRDRTRRGRASPRDDCRRAPA